MSLSTSATNTTSVLEYVSFLIPLTVQVIKKIIRISKISSADLEKKYIPKITFIESNVEINDYLASIYGNDILWNIEEMI